MRTDEWVVAENSRLCSTTLVRGVAGELEDESWRLGSTNLGRRAAGSGKRRTGDLAVQL